MMLTPGHPEAGSMGPALELRSRRGCRFVRQRVIADGLAPFTVPLLVAGPQLLCDK